MGLLDEICTRKYPTRTHWIDEGKGEGYFFAYLPDFGHAALSATGDTVEETLESLEIVKRDVVQVYLETGEKIPEPSGAPFEGEQLQQMPIRVTKELHGKLLERARKEGTSLNALINSILYTSLAIDDVEAAAIERIGKAASEAILKASQLNAAKSGHQQYLSHMNFLHGLPDGNETHKSKSLSDYSTVASYTGGNWDRPESNEVFDFEQALQEKKTG